MIDVMLILLSIQTLESAGVVVSFVAGVVALLGVFAEGVATIGARRNHSLTRDERAARIGDIRLVATLIGFCVAILAAVALLLD